MEAVIQSSQGFTTLNDSFVYCWTDHANGMLYVGFHKGDPDDGYVCSSNWMNQEYAKRQSDFTRQIIARGTFDDCIKLESDILKAVNARDDESFYNMQNGDYKFVCKHQTDATRKKISAATMGRAPTIGMTGKHMSDKSKSLMRAKAIGRPSSMRGKHLSDEAKAKISAAKKGVKKGPDSDITRMRKSMAMKGKPKSASHRKALSDANRGVKWSDERKAAQKMMYAAHPDKMETIMRNLEKAQANRKPRTEESKRKASERMHLFWESKTKEDRAEIIRKGRAHRKPQRLLPRSAASRKKQSDSMKAAWRKKKESSNQVRNLRH